MSGSYFLRDPNAGRPQPAPLSHTVPTLQHLVEGFRRVASDTTIPPVTIDLLANRWAGLIGSKHRSSTQSICKELNGLDWAWPTFDYTVRMLIRDDNWPTPWHHYRAKIITGADLRDVRSKILVASARTAGISARFKNDPQFMTMLKLQGWHLYSDSEVNAHYVSALAHHVRVDDWFKWPPLFPGDQSELKLGGEGGVFSRKGRFYGLDGARPWWVS